MNNVLESGMSYFRVLTVFLLLVYFVSAAECRCFDFNGISIKATYAWTLLKSDFDSFHGSIFHNSEFKHLIYLDFFVSYAIHKKLQEQIKRWKKIRGEVTIAGFFS